MNLLPIVNVITVSYEEYCAIGFSFILIGLFYTAKNMFDISHEVESDS